MKVWDIVQPRDNWERNYARMEYQRIVWHDLWDATKYIPITTTDQIFTCMTCGTLNTFWTYLCEECDNRQACLNG